LKEPISNVTTAHIWIKFSQRVVFWL